MRLFKWIKRKLIRFQCFYRGKHDFKWYWLMADSVYEIDVPECDCGASKILRWSNQTEYARGLCDALGYPDREDADKKIYLN